ncbi:MAG: hypothetical protein Q7S69_06165 [Nitrosomonadaceae bacterium]|nr:hypothetical protein [Nitrosomonadaceae bacterium]
MVEVIDILIYATAVNHALKVSVVPKAAIRLSPLLVMISGWLAIKTITRQQNTGRIQL